MKKKKINPFDLIVEPTKWLCSGWGVFPNGEKCTGCKDCIKTKTRDDV